MGRKRFKAEQIINMLREAEVLLNQGSTVGEVCRKLGISEQTYYRWRKECGGLRLDQTKYLRELERECPFEEVSSGAGAGHFHTEGTHLGKLLSPTPGGVR